MGWDVGIWGELKFPKGGFATWQQLDVDASTFKWKKLLAPSDPDKPEKVAKVLAKYTEWPKKRSGNEHLRIHKADDTVTFRGFLNEDSFEHAVHFAALFRSAGEAGGAGTLCLAAR